MAGVTVSNPVFSLEWEVCIQMVKGPCGNCCEFYLLAAVFAMTLFTVIASGVIQLAVETCFVLDVFPDVLVVMTVKAQCILARLVRFVVTLTTLLFKFLVWVG